MRAFLIGLFAIGSIIVVVLLAVVIFAIGWLVGYGVGQWEMTGKVVTHDPGSGRFLSEPKVTWLADGRNMQLDEDFVFVDSGNRAWLAEKGCVVNGASIPVLLWSILGGPFEGKYRNASIVHDAECEKMKSPSADVHRMFYDACRAGGVPERQAKMLYWAVANHGPQWQLVAEPIMMGAPDGSSTNVSVVVPRHMAAPELSDADLNWAKQYFIQHNPPIESIPFLKSEG